MAIILFVDDEALTLKLLNQAATILGHQALTSSTQEEALALAARLSPDLIVTDLNLNGQLSFGMIETLVSQQETKHIPVVTLSALDPSEIEERALSSGALAALSKPIRLQTLLDVIRDYTQHAD